VGTRVVEIEDDEPSMAADRYGWSWFLIFGSITSSRLKRAMGDTHDVC
jgi:hypothetical protein